MDPTLWKSIKDAFAQALDLPEDERKGFVSSIAPDIRPHVERLLKADSAAEGFIAEPILVDRGSVDETLGIPDRIDEYKIIKEIGTGGMGAVYLAENSGEGFKQRVALKLIKRGMDTSAVLKRFLMERQILANLEHSNIARMLDGGSTSDGVPYFVMEYVEGSEIRRYCDDNRFGLNERLDLFRKVCGAVSNAHQKLVVHRDLKPSNILVTDAGEPKLLDFGIAKLLAPDWSADTQEATLTQFRVMTPEYASPEQIAGEPTSTSTDVYSLGVILYELLTGQRPYDTRGKAPQELIESVLSKDPPRPSTVGTGATSGRSRQTDRAEDRDTNGNAAIEPEPENTVDRKLLQGDIDNIILKSLRREPERRYQSVQEFSEDIRRFQEGLPVSATADSRGYRFQKFFKRHKAGVIGGSAIALLLLTATGVTGWQYTVAQRERQKAEQRFNETRGLARSVLYELYDSIDAIPGSTKARELLAIKALEYLDRLAAEGSNDPYLLTELADGYHRIGNIQGGYGQANLGQSAEARKSYEKSLSILKAIVDGGETDPKFKTKLAFAYARMGDIDFLEANIQGYYENHKRSLDLLIEIEPERGSDIDLVYELGAAYINVGRGAATVNKPEEAAEMIKKGKTIFEELLKKDPANLRIINAVVLSHDNLGEVYSGFGNKQLALEEFRRSKALIEEALSANPDNADLMRTSVVSNSSIVIAATDLEAYDEAMASVEIAIERAKKLGANDSGNNDAAMMIALTSGYKGRILTRSGRWKEGIEVLQKSQAEFAKVVAKDPNNQIAPFQAAGFDDEIGRAYLAIGLAEKNPRERTAALQKARQFLQKAFDVYKKYRDAGITVAEDAKVTDEVEALLAKCDEALKR